MHYVICRAYATVQPGLPACALRAEWLCTTRSGAEAVELVAESAALLCQAPVQEPWSWWPAVQAAWQRGEHEQVRQA